MAVTAPRPLSTNPLLRVGHDLREQREVAARLPPGPTRFSLVRTRRMLVDPVPVLLDAYERYGPVFTIRILYANVVFALGPRPTTPSSSPRPTASAGARAPSATSSRCSATGC